MKKLFLLLFVVGIVFCSAVTIQEIQESETGVSPYVDQVVTTSGIVTAVNYNDNPMSFVMEDPAGGAWSGILVYDSGTQVAVGDEVEVNGMVIEYYELTEISGSQENPTSVTILSSNNTVPTPVEISTIDVNQEMYEGVLVKVNNAEIMTEFSQYNEIDINDGSGVCQIDDSFVLPSADNFDLSIGAVFNSVTGIVGYGFGLYELLPRTLDDFEQEGLLRADFSANITSGSSPLEVHFTNESVGDIISYSWDFDNDGNEDSSEENPSYTYLENGIYSVSLTVYSSDSENEKVVNNMINVYEDGSQIPLRVITYNTLYFGGDSEDRADYFKTVIEYSDADVILLQEVSNSSGSELFLETIQEIDPSYAAAQYVNGPSGPDCWLIYRSTKVSFAEEHIVDTVGRNIMRYECTVGGNTIFFYSCHLKASNTAEDEAQRAEEVQELIADINSLDNSANYVVAGDMNIYDDDEAAYQLFADNMSDLSPLIGNWHNNSAYRTVHTQCTRSTQFGGGSSGGLDDRFDFILASSNILAENNVTYVSDSYTVIGQDGNHYNGSVNDGTNDSAPQDVIDALYYASDHLPVIVDFNVEATVSIDDVSSLSESANLKVYPNPFVNNNSRSQSFVSFNLKEQQRVEINLFNAKGQKIEQLEDKVFADGEHKVSFKVNGKLSSGIYFVQLKSSSINDAKKFVIMK